MSQPVVMVIDPQPELIGEIKKDLQRSHQKLRTLYANSPLETLKKLKDLQLSSDTLTLLIVEQKTFQIVAVDLLQLVREMFPMVQPLTLKVHDSDDLPSCIPIPKAFVVSPNEVETALPDLQLMAHTS
ncbi:MAG: hypothetical protein N4J56_006126 [Chroococcidiopsis sp. SAG 2025]|uniref:hypothetical protein n=1 Tax=Chroococcidiopsis sp. SAG 2025 TaxID=171389 RepID=UPI0029371412|nr:hypothetical protein [Chroococcidiopsis sp. SAG 2025]MDV2996472.1 hypothetical protein [Chroococcidiopsis sp. SAG 2025]